MNIKAKLDKLEEKYKTDATVCPHLPHLLLFSQQDENGVLTPEPQPRRECEPYSPMTDASLQCPCNRERLTIHIVSVPTPLSDNFLSNSPDSFD